MNLTNFTEQFASNLNNPDCSMLSGMFMGNLLSFRLVFWYILIGLIIVFTSKSIGLFFDWIRYKLKLIKATADNNDFKKVCPECGNLTLSKISENVVSCENPKCTYIGKPIPKS